MSYPLNLAIKARAALNRLAPAVRQEVDLILTEISGDPNKYPLTTGGRLFNRIISAEMTPYSLVITYQISQWKPVIDILTLKCEQVPERH